MGLTRSLCNSSQRSFLKCTLVLLVHFSISLSFAQAPSEERKGSLSFVYSMVEVNTEIFKKIFARQSFLQLGFDSASQAATTKAVDLLEWKLDENDELTPNEPYNRRLHYGRWINDPSDDTCYNTRAKVLVRDSQTEVKFRGNNKCVVDSGEWKDPYTNTVLTLAKQLQIDHMVPLKNSFISGAWKWTSKARCLYANYLGEKFHLISSDGKENVIKGDRGPHEYLPPNESYTCEYLWNWLAIKLIWNLKMSRAESEGIKEVYERSGCNRMDFHFPVQRLNEQRQYIRDNIDLCSHLYPENKK